MDSEQQAGREDAGMQAPRRSNWVQSATAPRVNNGEVNDGALVFTKIPPREKPRRQRVTSRAVMTLLAVVAVLLTAGGIAGPQVVYAVEVLRFNELAQAAEDAADEAESLSVFTTAETLLWKLRSEEVRGVPARLATLGKGEKPALSSGFQTEAAASSEAIAESLAEPLNTGRKNNLAEKATKARGSVAADPKSWFDVDRPTVIDFAAIERKPAARFAENGTVTREQVETVKLLERENAELVEVNSQQLEGAVSKNEALAEAVSTATNQLVTESARTAKSALSELPAPLEELADLMLTPQLQQTHAQLTEDVRRDATTLGAAALVTNFGVDDAGAVIGLAPEADLPEGARAIPGGDAVRLNYLLPKLEKFVQTYQNYDESRAELERLEAEALLAPVAPEAPADIEPPQVIPLPDSAEVSTNGDAGANATSTDSIPDGAAGADDTTSTDTGGTDASPDAGDANDTEGSVGASSEVPSDPGGGTANEAASQLGH